MRIFFTAVGLIFALSLAKKEKLFRMFKLLEVIACYYYKYHPTKPVFGKGFCKYLKKYHD